LTKAELIAAVAERTGLKKKDAAFAVEAAFEAIVDSLKQGEKVSLVGFGTFEVRARAPRSGRNPQTGKPIKIAGRKVPAFKAGKGLKEAVAR
jgi:DNA-binding protein HU-beta